MWRVFFFFFQAEDGIRDLTVTGVQTCALPIFHPFGEAKENRQTPTMWTKRAWKVFLDSEEDVARAIKYVEANPSKEQKKRSEEHRVGKECRSRWSPYH